MTGIHTEIERLRETLREMGFDDSRFADGLSPEQIDEAVRQHCPALAECPVPEEAVAWFGWQNGMATAEQGEVVFSPCGARLAKFETTLSLANSLIEHAVPDYTEERFHVFPLFSDIGGCHYAMCGTATGWRLMFSDREEGGWAPIPQANRSLSDDESPTFTQWLTALNDAIDDGRISTANGIDRERPPPNDDWDFYYSYPWT